MSTAARSPISLDHAQSDFAAGNAFQIAQFQTELVADAGEFALQLPLHVLHKGTHRVVFDQVT